MATIEIDGVQYTVKEGESLLAACHTLGLDLPYFCWHPALGSVGACRQCAVIQYRDADDTRGRLVMACMTPVADAMRISIKTDQATQFRSGNIELLMTNHPHDCPVCEEGGECHLQDMTLMSGHTVRRYRGLKRTHQNQYLGPFINHEMNRCIACYRCVRFYDDYAGGSDLHALGVSNNVYFGRFEDGTLESEFSGNLVEVCPTGVFTDKTFSAHFARKWDLQTAPSVCVHCGLGCNIAPGERYGELRRVVNRYNGEVNGYFLCDRGRFGYGFVNSPERIRLPLLNGRSEIANETAEQHFRELLKNGQPVIGVGSPRASLEANFALRTLVGEENFFLGLEETEQTLFETIVDLLRYGGIHTPSLREVEQADAVLILGEDLTNSAPRLALSVRQAARNAALDLASSMHISPWLDEPVRELEKNNRSPIFIAGICATRLDDVAAHCYRGSPEDIARLGFAIARGLDPQAPAPADLSATEHSLAAVIAESLKSAKRPLVVSGTSCASLAVIQAAFNVAKALSAKDKQLIYTVPECNSLGLAMMGGRRMRQAFERVNEKLAETVIILENDLYRRAQEQDVDAFLRTAAHVVVLDSLNTQTADNAELLLPAATFAESEGTLVSNEGRAQRYFPVYPAAEPVRGSWQWLLAGMETTDWKHCDELTAACAEAFPALAAIAKEAPDGQFRIAGMKIPRQPHRYSGRTAMLANIKVSEPRQTVDPETPFAFSMEGITVGVPAALEPVIWAPGWNSNQAINKFQDEIGGHLRGGDAGARLIEATGAMPWFTHIPDAFKPMEGQWRIVPLQHIFGSEELSRHSPPVAERMANPCASLSPSDAAVLAVESGDLLEIKSLTGISIIYLPVKIEQTLPCGLLGITAGLPETLGISRLSLVVLTKADKTFAFAPAQYPRSLSKASDSYLHPVGNSGDKP
ncbi:NADH-quinone oxidoreductase subunit NuoG [Methylomicrobium sp. Wu6]|uniref:NADH-quinone oxidoreductase subunit NuoG n=1 Tax=Methylomicrobium sp. Wu6 TaxID=3107928 RepID=UPI002DD69CFC|nr:NADH-quinone oxidoreductase subunit NuoG [Methylomicrobium sp. Wu6]MEC4748475.1 NADH-quinone oxidoreductase subunit NuoG [Methylomicrobium sp. Wu6]